jgi:hypothetical protein
MILGYKKQGKSCLPGSLYGTHGYWFSYVNPSGQTKKYEHLRALGDFVVPYSQVITPHHPLVRWAWVYSFSALSPKRDKKNTLRALCLPRLPCGIRSPFLWGSTGRLVRCIFGGWYWGASEVQYFQGKAGLLNEFPVPFEGGRWPVLRRVGARKQRVF